MKKKKRKGNLTIFCTAFYNIIEYKVPIWYDHIYIQSKGHCACLPAKQQTEHKENRRVKKDLGVGRGNRWWGFIGLRWKGRHLSRNVTLFGISDTYGWRYFWRDPFSCLHWVYKSRMGYPKSKVRSGTQIFVLLRYGFVVKSKDTFWFAR